MDRSPLLYPSWEKALTDFNTDSIGEMDIDTNNIQKRYKKKKGIIGKDKLTHKTKYVLLFSLCLCIKE